MIFLEYVLSLAVVLGILIFIHELGHFLAGKFFGVRIEVFSLGFGPRLLGFRLGETDYRLSLVPLGGYVKMAGEFDEDEGSSAERDPRWLTSRPRWQRIVIYLAGPAMNVALAMGIWWGLYLHGAEVLDVPKGPPVVEAVADGSPAEAAGLRPGDRIVAVDGEPIEEIGDYQEVLRQELLSPGRTFRYEVERDGKRLTVPVTITPDPLYGVGWDGVRIRLPVMVGQVVPGSAAERAGLRKGDRILRVDGQPPLALEDVSRLLRGKAGREVTLDVERDGREMRIVAVPEPTGDGGARLGVMLTYPTRFVRFGPLGALREAAREAWRNAGLLFRTLSALVRRQVGLGVMSGPLEIAKISRDQAALGIVPFLQLLAVISIQLGIINLFPIPVLDGGQILILVVEMVKGGTLPPALKERILMVGLAIVLLLGILIVAVDIRKAFVRYRSSRAAEPPAHGAPAGDGAGGNPAEPAPAP